MYIENSITNCPQAPEPPANWTGVRNATTHGASCPQIDIFTSELYPGSENCLFLNVYTPNVDCTTLLPVMFFIHGGGYKSGSGNSSSYGADFLVNQSVVLVTINYRLEALGFLCLDTKEIPGNAGLKDQVAALRWVKENIVNFGGDPDCITIIGQSAGAASVGYHILSPMSKGLFNRAIAMSGTPLCDFTISYKPVERAFILGKQLGIDTNDTTVLMNYLQNVTVDQLYNTSCTVLTSEEIFSNFIKFFSFAPVNETDFGNNNTFITKDVMEMMTNGTPNAVDVMLGYTNLETVTVIDTFNSTYMKIYDRYPEMLVPTKIFFRFPPDINLEVSKQIRNYYFGNATINVDVIKQFVLFTSQASFQYDIIRFINILPEMCNNSRYMYKFSMSSGLNTYGNQGIKYGLNGAVGHLDDLMYIFMNNNVNTSLLAENSTEMTLIVNFSTMIANFAKYG